MDSTLEKIASLCAARVSGEIDHEDFLEKIALNLKIRPSTMTQTQRMPFFRTPSNPLTISQHKPSVLQSTKRDFDNYSKAVSKDLAPIRQELSVMSPNAGPQLKFDPAAFNNFDPNNFRGLKAHDEWMVRSSTKPAPKAPTAAETAAAKADEVAARKITDPEPKNTPDTAPAGTQQPQPQGQPQQPVQQAQSSLHPWQILGGLGAGAYVGSQLSQPNITQYGYPRIQNSWM